LWCHQHIHSPTINSNRSIFLQVDQPIELQYSHQIKLYTPYINTFFYINIYICTGYTWFGKLKIFLTLLCKIKKIICITEWLSSVNIPKEIWSSRIVSLSTLPFSLASYTTALQPLPITTPYINTFFYINIYICIYRIMSVLFLLLINFFWIFTEITAPCESKHDKNVHWIV
jgi:hypothetical protein